MVPSAPGLSSTTTGLPHFLPSASANIRAAASLALPGGNVTISFTGRSGHSARAAFGKANTALQARTTIRQTVRRPAPALGCSRRDFPSEKTVGGIAKINLRRNIIIVALPDRPAGIRIFDAAFGDRCRDEHRNRWLRSPAPAYPEGRCVLFSTVAPAGALALIAARGATGGASQCRVASRRVAVPAGRQDRSVV